MRIGRPGARLGGSASDLWQEFLFGLRTRTSPRGRALCLLRVGKERNLIWSWGPFRPQCRGTRLPRAGVQLSSWCGDGGIAWPRASLLGVQGCVAAARSGGDRSWHRPAGPGGRGRPEGRCGGREFRAFLRAKAPGTAGEAEAGHTARCEPVEGLHRLSCSLLWRQLLACFLNHTLGVTLYDVVSFAVLKFDLISHWLAGYAN